MLIAPLVITAKIQRQPKCPSVCKWINELWYSQRKEHYSALKINELVSHEKPWRKLKYILLNEETNIKGYMLYIIPILRHYYMKSVKISVVAKGEWWGHRGQLRQ